MPNKNYHSPPLIIFFRKNCNLKAHSLTCSNTLNRETEKKRKLEIEKARRRKIEKEEERRKPTVTLVVILRAKRRSANCETSTSPSPGRLWTTAKPTGGHCYRQKLPPPPLKPYLSLILAWDAIPRHGERANLSVKLKFSPSGPYFSMEKLLSPPSLPPLRSLLKSSLLTHPSKASRPTRSLSLPLNRWLEAKWQTCLHSEETTIYALIYDKKL